MSTTTLLHLLGEQYTVTESYANSQSRLLNASMTSSSSTTTDDNDEVLSAIKYATISRSRVRSVLQRLEQDDCCKAYPDHVALSKRVAKTIANNPSWHANGLPSHVNGVLENNTVALAALKASIARITEIESERS